MRFRALVRLLLLTLSSRRRTGLLWVRRRRRVLCDENEGWQQRTTAAGDTGTVEFFRDLLRGCLLKYAREAHVLSTGESRRWSQSAG